MAQITALSFLVLALAWAGAADARDLRDPRDFLRANATVPPESGVVSVCHAYGCTRITRVRLGAAEIGRLRAIMSVGRLSAQTERQAFARAVSYLEDVTAPVAGTAADRDYRDLGSGGDPSQMDCIDEAANTTSYLLLLQDLGLIRHHVIAHPVTKGVLIDFTYPHTTAVIVERETGARYAVDSWVFTNGEPPIIVPLDTWYDTKSETFYRQRHRS